MTTVLVVEDEPMLLRRYADAVGADPDATLVAAVGSVALAIAAIDAHRPDVVLVDLGLPDGHGVEVIRHAARRRPEGDVLVVTMFADDGNVIDSIAAGATGYLVKDASMPDIATSIRTARQGGAPISPAIARRILQRYKSSMAADPPTRPPPVPATAPAIASILSVREIDVLGFVAKGLNFKEIGALLDLSPHTITTHVKNIYRKLAVHSRGEAVYEARQLGLL